MSVTLLTGDCRDVLRTFDACSVDAIVTDPPYGLGFMGVKWDTYREEKGRGPSHKATFDQVGGNSHARKPGGVELIRGKENRRFQGVATAWAEAMLRVAKPGAHLLAFGGTRTFHRLTCAIEDAGWEIRDCLSWLYGSGFPKSLNLAGDWQGWGTALKPAWEPIILARKPLAGTVAENVTASGCGALNIDGCRIGGTVETWPTSRSYARKDTGAPSKGTQSAGDAPAGRWPANVVLDEAAAAQLDAQSGERSSGLMRAGSTRSTRSTRSVCYGAMPDMATLTDTYGDSGGASRFFYTSKASRADRGTGNIHPTVKPADLMQWLVRLVTPPGGTVLDPFMGSGSTGVAAVREGFDFIGIELSPEYFAIAQRRLAMAQSEGHQPSLLGASA